MIGDGVRFSWLTFDEDYGSVPAFWFGLDALGQRGIGEVKYFVGNASAQATLAEMMEVAFGRWPIEKWFERAKQETGFGGKNPKITLEPATKVVNTLASKTWRRHGYL